MKFISVLLFAFITAASPRVDCPEFKTHIVKIEGMKFVPKRVEIRVGETIQWINESNGSHNVIENEDRFKSKMLSKKLETFEFTFSKPGTYNYYCEPHKSMGMKGVIEVIE